MNQESHIISQQVFGSSKKLQFISMESVSTSHSDNIHQFIHLPKPNTPTKRSMSIESMLDSNGSPEHEQRQRIAPPTPTMKRHWLPSTYDDRLHKHRRHDEKPKPAPVEQQQQQLQHPQPATKQKTTISCLHAAVAQKSYGSEKRFLCPPPMIALEQQHPSAYCPTIAMSVLAEGNDRPVEQCAALDDNKRASFKYLHVTGSSKTKQFCLRVNMTYSSLSGASATKNSGMNGPPFATFFSSPISIISKPSKKTAKARNVSSCIFTTSQISLYNRINSQTVRTKYLTSAPLESEQQLCAKNSSWSAFDIILVHQPTPPPQQQSLTYYNHQQYHHNHQLSVTTAGVPLTYGSHVILKDSQSGVCSPPVIIRKVEKSAIAATALGPVSQMQKIALQLESSVDSADGPMYLSSNGSIIQDTNLSDDLDENNNNNGGPNHAHSSTWLDQCNSKSVPDPKSTTGAMIEKVDDCFCWTIVGIAKFEYTVDEPMTPPQPPSSSLPPTEARQPLSPSTLSTSHHFASHPQINKHHPQHRQQEIMPRLLQPSPPPSPPRTIVPFPMVSSVSYQQNQHCLDLVGQHLVQHLPSSASPHLLEFWLGGAHGPLPVVQQHHHHHQQHTVTQGNIQLKLELPHTQDFLIAHHDLLVKKAQGDRSLELPLLMVRKDNVVYHSGKSVICHVECNGDTHWAIMDVTVAR
ncbi:unnamed protein product [Absidia cylindrospora]